MSNTKDGLKVLCGLLLNLFLNTMAIVLLSVIFWSYSFGGHHLLVECVVLLFAVELISFERDVNKKLDRLLDGQNGR